MPAYYINCRNPVNLFAPPFARALLSGGEGFPGLWGKVDFCLCPPGLLILCEFRGLPYDADPCAPNLFALHLHQEGSCASAEGNAFGAAGGHYNPGNCPHPSHAGDFPPVFSNHGYAFSAFYSERLRPEMLPGRSVILHSRRDDFTSQPAGDSGARIACGIVRKI